jgi:glycosyltransferase involved in cell wall biosynthesis
MKVLFVGPNLAAGGAERQWSILLPGLRERGIDARLIALDGGGPMAEPLHRSGVPFDVIDMRHQADLRRLLRSGLVRGFVPDAVVSRSVSGLYVGYALARWRRAAHVHNDHRQVGMALTPRREAMTRLLARRIDRVIVVSADQVEAWRERHYPAERIVRVANGVDAPEIADTKLEIRRELGIAQDAVAALLVATLRPEKDVPAFVRAVRRARETQPELIGLVAGEGPDRPAVEQAAAGDPAVRLLGHRDDITRLLKAADLFVLSSRFEAVPMAILEAMAAGLPVLATGVGSIPDMVADGQSGLLVDPGDADAMAGALATLAADRSLREAMGAQGAQRHRERWNADTMVEGYARVLEELRPPADPTAARSSSELTSVPGARNRKL